MKDCASCGSSNDADARFCEECGSGLARRCPSCRAEVKATAKFCKGCGTGLDVADGSGDAARADSAVRKTVTVLFADLGGSTTFQELVDAETARAVMARYDQAITSIATERGAGSVKYLGDGVMAVWGVPEIGPNDAVSAVDAAVAMHEAFEPLQAEAADRFGAEITLRIAINSGEVVVGDDDADIVGDAVNVAARLEKECPLGRVVVGGDTWRAVRSDYEFDFLGDVQVKGRTAPVAVHLLTGGQQAETIIPFVGRESEVGRLRDAFHSAVHDREVRLVSVVGEPGVGKTRLSREFTGGLGARVVEFACEADGGVALGPIVDVLRTVTNEEGQPDLRDLVPYEVVDRDRILEVLDDLVGGGSAHSVEETFWGLRRLVEVSAVDQPLVLVVDDIQWADPLLLDFLEHLVEWVRESPVLIVALARPEIREVRPALGEPSRWVSDALSLTGLDDGATQRLAAKLLGSSEIPTELVDRIPGSTKGNPLFVRELVRMLVYDRVLERVDGRWRLTVDVDAIEIPPTVHSLLATRIERIDRADRRLLEVASVIGTDFDLGAATTLLGVTGAAVLAAAERLRRLQLMEPAGSYSGDDPVWRFHHVLIRDVAYRRLLKQDRAGLHERLAGHLQEREQRGHDVDEPVARQLEAAHRYRVELGDDADALGRRAAERFLRAARRAVDRDELGSAGELAASGVSLVGEERSLGAELAMLGCEALLSAQDATAGASMVDRLAEFVAPAQQPWLMCFAAQLSVLTDPDALPDAEGDLTLAIEQFAEAGDDRGLAKAYLVRANTRARLGRIGDCEADLDQALVAARRADDRRRVTAVLGSAPLAALWGPSPVPRAGGRCLDVIRLQRITTAAPSVEATSVRCQAVLEALRGRIDNARSMIASARQTVTDLGLRHGMHETDLFHGIIETIAGEHAAAEPHLRRALEGLDALGVGVDAGQAAALLAKCLVAQGRVEEADRYASESEKLAGQNLKTAIAWRSARAEILAAAGEHDDAVVLAIEAVDIGARTDIVLDHADALLTLARVRDAAGDQARAAEARARAEELYGAKGAVALVGVAESVGLAPPTVRGDGRVDRGPLALQNLATRRADLAAEAWRSRDVDRILEFYEPDFQVVAHRSVVSSGATRGEEAIAVMLSMLEAFPITETEVIAVRGDRLMLTRQRYADQVGSEVQMLTVVEHSASGRVQLIASFDPDDLVGAVAELDERYLAGEGEPYAESMRGYIDFMAAMNGWDWDLLRRSLNPDFRMLPSQGLLVPAMDVDTYVAYAAAVYEDARTAAYSSAIEWVSAEVCVTRTRSRIIGDDGFVSEFDVISVARFRDGKMSTSARFRIESIDAAYAYADRLVRSLEAPRLALENEATRWLDRMLAASRRRDADAVRRLYEPEVRRIDHRAGVSAGEAVGPEAVESALALLDVADTISTEIIAIRGERLVLYTCSFIAANDFAVELLLVSEISERGLGAANVAFDPADFSAALAELDARYNDAEGAPYAENNRAYRTVLEGIAAGDWDLVRSAFHEDFRAVSARASALPELSLDEYVAYEQALADDSTTHRFWTSVFEWVTPTLGLALVHRENVSADGSISRWDFAQVTEYGAGKILRGTQFQIEDLENAIALADELASDRDTVPPSVSGVTRWLERFREALEARDDDRVRALYEPDVVRSDRRSSIHGGDIEGEEVVRSALALVSVGDVEWNVVALRGEQLGVTRIRFRNDNDFVIEMLAVVEISSDGRMAAIAQFDSDDLDAAMAELDRRAEEGSELP